MVTNKLQQKKWEERPQQDTYTYNYNVKGVPVETMVELGNRLTANS
ncbi:MAG: hypothetical protein GDA44_04485 [Prochloron sp. SP5CPC1]|nr:hypothetical protein [Candidatus Paraprochloron terpiosi SP5CPC1]